MKALQMPDWHGLVARSRGFRVMAVLLVPVAAASLVWFASLREVGQNHRAAAALERDVLQKLATRRAEVAALEDDRVALLSARQRLQEARWRLDAGEGMSELLDQLAMSGHEHGLVFERVDVLDEEQPGVGYRRVPVEIRVQGRYPSLRAWLEQWLQQLRLLEVARISLAGIGDSNGLVSARLRVQVYDSGEALPVPASLADEAARPAVSRTLVDLFQPFSYGAAAVGLERIPLEQLAMVGSLSRGGRHQALLQAAGRLYRVEEGQRLGRDDGVVVRVDAQQMEVRERLYIAGGWQERSRFLALGKGARKEVMDELETGVERAGDSVADERQAGAGDALQG